MSNAPVDNLLALLDGVKPAGKNKWSAKCPAHDDTHASLSIGTGDDGRALVKCQAGCATPDVLATVGLKMADLYPPKADKLKTSGKGKGRIVATYDYRDSAGVLLYQVVRFDPKEFKQRRPDGEDHYVWGLNAGEYVQGKNGDWYTPKEWTPADAPRKHFSETPRVLYRLPELLAANKGAWVFVNEGEKDCDNVAALGFVATCNPGGAGKWSKLSDDSALHGQKVAIIADRDAPGLAHAQDVATRLNGKAAEVKIIDLPAEIHGQAIKDVSDWIEAQDTKLPEDLAAALVSMAGAAPEWTPPAETQPAEVTEESNGQPASIIVPMFKTIRELVNDHPALRPPVIHGLLREGESLNVIAQSKKGKSWLVGDLALALATGRPWMGQFPTEQGDVLILDNELHRETTAYRIPRIAEARGISLDEYGDHVIVDNLRGRLLTILGLPAYLAGVKPGRFKVIVLDALYRFWPPDTSENDNAAIAGFYNIIDSIAGRLNCCFVLIHHSSKGSQATKSLVDVGAGAGAIARAADCHLTLIAHEQDSVKAPVVVLDAGPRSWPPVEPVCLRFTWPVWATAPELDPAALKPDRPRRQKTEKPAESEPAKPLTDEALEFARKYITKEPQTRATIADAAVRDGVTESRAKKLLAAAEGRKLAFRWKLGSTSPIQFATVEQPKLDLAEGGK